MKRVRLAQAAGVVAMATAASMLGGFAPAGGAHSAARHGAHMARPLYKNPKAPVAARIADLMKHMTVEDKVAQLECVWNNKAKLLDPDLQFDPAKAAKIYPHGFGAFARPSDYTGTTTPMTPDHPGRDTRQTVALVNAVQHWAVEQTRLGIPVLFHEEGLHGYVAPGATSFPQAIAEASTWDPKLVQQVDTVAGREIRAVGVYEVLAPVVDVVRDPRWGRSEETFGEDPYLVSRMGVAAVRGFQGTSLPLAPGHVFATLKHMTGHGWPENGTNVGPANIGRRTLRSIFLPPFKAAIDEANAQIVMASYNEIDGVPSHANHWLLTDLLRHEWGFKGLVVSDYEGIEQLDTLHHVEPDLASAAIRALEAGVDVDMPDGEAFATLVKSIREGRVPMADVNRAVRGILRIKFLAGLFEHPYADADTAVAITNDAQAQALAAKVARKAVILLKNDGTLPLDANRIKTLAVIGPNAKETLLGGYSSYPGHTVSILQGIKAKLGDRVHVVYSEGVKITRTDHWWSDKVELADPQKNAQRIADAVKVAQGADEIVLVLGGNPNTSREGWADNHLGDRSSLGLLSSQNALFDAMRKLGKPVVVVLLNGRPLAVPELADKANALIEGWYLGEKGGTAMADILFGDANPGGKLPVSIPRSVGQLPDFYNVKPSARRGYLFSSIKPLYPFGYGLSYTTFAVSAPRLSSTTIGKNQSVNVAVDVRNTGKRTGDEVVQLYIHDLVSSVTTPIKELKGFERVTLKPGETRTVTFTLTPDALALWNADMKHVVEPGDFDIMAGDSSVNLKSVVLHVHG